MGGVHVPQTSAIKGRAREKAGEVATRKVTYTMPDLRKAARPDLRTAITGTATAPSDLRKAARPDLGTSITGTATAASDL